MEQKPNSIEDETQKLIWRGEDILARTQEVARKIVRRVWRTMREDTPRPAPPGRNATEPRG